MPNQISARLEGGPLDLPQSVRSSVVQPDTLKVKIGHNGGYEHFERTDADNAAEPDPIVIFRWTMRTKIAE